MYKYLPTLPQNPNYTLEFVAKAKITKWSGFGFEDESLKTDLMKSQILDMT